MDSFSDLAAVLARISLEKRSLAAVLVHLNDTYLIDERPEQQLPGFPRVTTTIRTIRRHVRRVLGEDRTLVLHSGDFLAPSRASKKDKGKVMVQLLNGMGLDYCTLGNHEFDYKDAVLRKRLGEAKFKVLLANVRCRGVELSKYETWPANGKPLVALTGVVSESVYQSFDNRKQWKYSPEVEAVGKFVDRARKIPFRVILTHAKWSEDRALRRYMPRRTYFLGGHDHDIAWKTDDGPLLLKNLSNFRTLRVILLLAGGEGVSNALTYALGRWNTNTPQAVKQNAALYSDPGKAYRAAIRKITKSFHPVDAAVIRDRLVEPPRQPDPVGVRAILKGSRSCLGYAQLYDAVDRGMLEILNHPDEAMLEMDHTGHGPADKTALRLVAKAIPFEPAEDKVVADFSRDFTGKLDASDEHLRNGSTDFGLLTVECVRREAGADFALLNSGSFRCDAELPSRLRLRDVRDTFLYDEARAVVVLDLPEDVLRKALEHGRKQTGNGAYPQTSHDQPPPKTSKVAIAAYLVEKKGQGDGYGKVIADGLGIGIEELWERAATAPIAFSLETAVTKWATIVGYRPVPVSLGQADPLAEFLGIVDAMIDANKVLFGSKEWRESVASDDPLEDKELERFRNQLRDWIRKIPEVAALEALYPRMRRVPRKKWPKSFEAEIVAKSTAAYHAMLAFRTAISTCPRSFATRRPYDTVFDFAAVRIGTWQ